MSHWGYMPHYQDNHRIRFDEVLTPRCLAALSSEQRAVLWVGRDFDIAPQYVEEQHREAGVVRFGVAAELPHLARQLRERARRAHQMKNRVAGAARL